MHPQGMYSKSVAEWEDVMDSRHSVGIKSLLEKEFPQYDFRVGGSITSFRIPLCIQVGRGLSDNEFHVILGFCKAAHRIMEN